MVLLIFFNSLMPSLVHHSMKVKAVIRDGAREEMLGGAKTVRVPTASEASKIFTGHTFQIGLKCDCTL